MIEQSFEHISPAARLPAGLISWYATDGSPVTLVTAWVALVGGDFILNVPYENELNKIRKVLGQGEFCLYPQDLGYTFVSGIVAVAPRLLDCAVQIECVGGRLVESDFDAVLCGRVVRMHREQVVIDPTEIPELCAIQPLMQL